MSHVRDVHNQAMTMRARQKLQTTGPTPETSLGTPQTEMASRRGSTDITDIRVEVTSGAAVLDGKPPPTPSRSVVATYIINPEAELELTEGPSPGSEDSGAPEARDIPAGAMAAPSAPSSVLLPSSSNINRDSTPH